MMGVRLVLLHPKWAKRSCDDCQTYMYQDDPKEAGHGEPMMRGGQKMTRSRGDFPPCSICPKIHEKDPKLPCYAQELSERNRKAFRHWQECKAVGKFPDDPTVRKNAGIIQTIWDQWNRNAIAQPINELVGMIPILIAGRHG